MAVLERETVDLHLQALNYRVKVTQPNDCMISTEYLYVPQPDSHGFRRIRDGMKLSVREVGYKDGTVVYISAAVALPEVDFEYETPGTLKTLAEQFLECMSLPVIDYYTFREVDENDVVR